MKLDGRIEDFKRAPAPDLWPEIERREPLVELTTAPAGWRRLVVVAAALAIGVAGVTLAVHAFSGTRAAVQSTAPEPTNGVIAYAPIGKQAEFLTINPDGSGERSVPVPVPGFVGVPSWSPDGSRIVFAVNSFDAQSSEGGNWDIYVANADGTDPVRLTTDRVDHSPTWSPDGTKIAYVYGYGGDQQIRVMNADGSGVQELTSDHGFHSSPAWSPGGSQIAYVAFDGTNSNIYVMNSDGSDSHQVTDDPAHEDAPAWSPDGQLIAFTSEGGSRDPGVYTMSPDGSGVAEWAHDPDPANLSIAWSPDGTEMALVSIRGAGNDRNVYVLDVASHDVAAIGRPGAYYGVSWQPLTGLASYTDPSGWTIDYPSDWSVTPIAQTSDGLGSGTSISNTDQPDAPDAVGLTITHAIATTPDKTMSSTALPLSIDNFGTSPGGSNQSSLDFRLGGIRYLATLKAGSVANPADIAAVRRMIASIRPVGIAPVNPGQFAPLGQPCIASGDRTSLDTAAAGTGYQLLVPHDSMADAASSDSLIGVWRCPGDGVEMAFASGITLTQEANTFSDPGKAWQRLADEDSADTSVGTVQGQPAALIDPAKSIGGALGSVTVVIDGTIVWVVGTGHVAIADLVRVADSLQPA
jgi:hypothetical protein